jgi:hypothetical protein
MIRKSIIPFILLVSLWLAGCEEFANMQKENAIFDVAEHQDMTKSEFAKRYKDYKFRCTKEKDYDFCSFETPNCDVSATFRGQRLLDLYITHISKDIPLNSRGIYNFNLPVYPVNDKKSNHFTISYEGNVPGWKNVYIQSNNLKNKRLDTAWFGKESYN